MFDVLLSAGASMVLEDQTDTRARSNEAIASHVDADHNAANHAMNNTPLSDQRQRHTIETARRHGLTGSLHGQEVMSSCTTSPENKKKICHSARDYSDALHPYSARSGSRPEARARLCVQLQERGHRALCYCHADMGINRCPASDLGAQGEHHRGEDDYGLGLFGDRRSTSVF